jgi:hypothetical protein
VSKRVKSKTVKKLKSPAKVNVATIQKAIQKRVNKARILVLVLCPTFAILLTILAVIELSTFSSMLEILEQDAGESRLLQLIFSSTGAIPLVIGLASVAGAILLVAVMFVRK